MRSGFSKGTQYYHEEEKSVECWSQGSGYRIGNNSSIANRLQPGRELRLALVEKISLLWHGDVHRLGHLFRSYTFWQSVGACINCSLERLGHR